MATSNTSSNAATIVRIEGKAYVKTSEGQLVALKPGDHIEQGQQLSVDPQGHLLLQLANGQTLDLGGGRTITANEELLNQAIVDRSEAAIQPATSAEVQSVITALDAGQDPFNTLDPTAAGLTGGAATDGGHSFVRLLRIMEDVTPLQDFAFSAAAVQPDLVVPAGDTTNTVPATTTATTTTVPAPTITLSGQVTPDNIINAAEAQQTIAITGTVGGDAQAGDTVTLTVNGTTYTGQVVNTAGVLGFSIDVPGTVLAADPDHTIEASVTTTNAAGNTGSSTATESYTVDTGTLTPTVTLSSITADNIVNAAEAGTTIAVTGTAGGDAKAGDTVTLIINGKNYTGTVQTDLSFSIDVPGTALATDPDHTIDASISTQNSAGNTGTGSSTETYAVDILPPSVTIDIVATSLNASQSSTITFTFSETPVGFTTADITAVGGTVSGLVATSNPLVYTAVFTPTAGYSGTASVSVTPASYTDAAGNTGTGGNDSVDIVLVPPTNTLPGSVSAQEDTPQTISGVSVTDVDSSTLTTTVSVTHGTLTVTTGSGASITNPGTSSVTLVGTAAQINAALAGLTYTNTADYNGADTLTVSTSDGTTAAVTNTTDITVTPVADIASDTITTLEDTTVNIVVNTNDSFENTGHTITAIDGTAIAVGGTVAVANGTVTLKADGSLDFAPAANYNNTSPTTFTYTVTSGGVTETATVSVNVTQVNDPAIITPATPGADAGAVKEDVTPTTSGQLSVTDVDAGQASFVAQTNVAGAHGTFSIDSTGKWTYTLDNTDPAVQALGEGQSL
ncbi:MAG: hypothetical protein H6R19_3388, partial [Proteobacteria bacterium]|nr:hypothetical protein [Pseudomonadota bacterium]